MILRADVCALTISSIVLVTMPNASSTRSCIFSLFWITYSSSERSWRDDFLWRGVSELTFNDWARDSSLERLEDVKTDGGGRDAEAGCFLWAPDFRHAKRRACHSTEGHLRLTGKSTHLLDSAIAAMRLCSASAASRSSLERSARCARYSTTELRPTVRSTSSKNAGGGSRCADATPVRSKNRAFKESSKNLRERNACDAARRRSLRWR
eukprot:3753012-Prymnesium_polylepis.1